MKLARSLFRLALSLYPERLREERGEMELIFEQVLEREWQRSPWLGLLYLVRSLVDALVFGLPRRLFEGVQGVLNGFQGLARISWVGAFGDWRHAGRLLWRRKATTLATVLSLAMGLGAVTALFSLFDAAVLRPLPVDGAERMLGVVSQREHGQNGTFPYPDFLALQNAVAEHAAVVAYQARPGSVRTSADSSRATRREFIELVSWQYFHTLGIKPALGQVFDRASIDDAPVAVAGYRYWTAQLEGRLKIGDTLSVNGQPVTLIGVTPPGFSGLQGDLEPALFVPIENQTVIEDPGYLQGSDVSWLYWAVIPHPGTDASLVHERLEHAALNYWQETGRDWELGLELQRAVTGFPQPVSDYVPLLRLSLGLVLLVLLSACLNAASLQLSAGVARWRELAARRALGASRRRLLAQLMGESALIGGIACVLGVVLAFFTVRILILSEPLRSSLQGLEVGLDARVLGFALVAVCLSTLMFGLLPALSLTRSTSATVLRTGPATSLAKRPLRLQKTLTVLQVALSFVLLVVALLLATSVHRLERIDPGIERAPVLMASLDLRAAGYEPGGAVAAMNEVLQQVDSLPGVHQAALASSRPVSPFGSRRGYEIAGYQPEPSDDMELDTNAVSPGYFGTLGIRLIEGSLFPEQRTPVQLEQRPTLEGDEPPLRRVDAVVNQIFVDRFFAHRSAVDRTMTSASLELRIVGVVADGKYRSLREDPRPMVYLDYREHPRMARRMSLLARTQGAPLDLLEPVRQVVAQVDPELPLFNVMTLEQQLARASANERLSAWLFGVLASVVLLLVSVGLFALMSYQVRVRRAELGVRTALGALPSRLVKDALRLPMRLYALGVGLGLGLSLAVGRMLESLLYGVSAADPRVLLGATLLLLAGALLACFAPIRRALRLDPVSLLRD